TLEPAGEAAPAGSKVGPLAAQAILLAAFAAWALAAGLLAPLYRRLYAHTHAAAFDERGRVPITPPPGVARAEAGVESETRRA
ncbi:MAG: hypothetical protein WCP98_09330, partial [Actinomycetes bacterium]